MQSIETQHTERRGWFGLLCLGASLLALAGWPGCSSQEPTDQDSGNVAQNSIDHGLEKDRAGAPQGQGEMDATEPKSQLLEFPTEQLLNQATPLRPAPTPYSAHPGLPAAGDLSKAAGPGDALAALSPGEELWVIEKSDGVSGEAGEETPGTGCLMTRVEEVEVPVPLKHTDVRAEISGYVATVQVTQKFHNPYSSKIEAVYVFPLPQNAAVNEFVMTIGERKIRGIVRERGEAEEIYRQARQRGHVASLMTQERPNIFTQRVANIEPGKAIDIDVKYFNTLAYRDGWYEFVFPMVVGPRFNPPGDAGGIGAVARNRGASSGQKTAVEYLRPGERSGHDIALACQIDAGVKIEELESVNHAVDSERASEGRVEVRLSPNDSIPNRDFVLRYRVAGKRIKHDLLTYRDERGGFFSLMLFPPEDIREIPRQPVELVFVMDCSGSMSGKPIAKAKQAAERALKRLNPDDTFQIIRFSESASQLGPKPILATPENVRRGLDYLRGLEGSGGTMMIEGIKAALDFPGDDLRMRLVSFMTDGYIGNEAQILAAIHEKLGASRIFSFGVGSSVNRYLLESMARLGRGAVAYVGLDESAGRAVDRFYERFSHPAMTDLEVDWGGLEVEGVYPTRLPDLLVGRPVIVTGRFASAASGTVRISGRIAGKEKSIAFPIDLERSTEHAGIASVWARTRVADLSDRYVQTRDSEIPQEIKEVALDFGLMSSYTAFIAVDSLSRTTGDFGTTVQVPVPVPEGVRYDTTVGR